MFLKENFAGKILTYKMISPVMIVRNNFVINSTFTSINMFHFLGGTTVPLEMNTVRYVDNFSLGTRFAQL